MDSVYSGAYLMASRERPAYTLDSVHLTRSTHAGETRTLLPGHQFRVATGLPDAARSPAFGELLRGP